MKDVFFGDFGLGIFFDADNADLRRLTRIFKTWKVWQTFQVSGRREGKIYTMIRATR